jgi:hypothetical protein
MLTVNVEGVLGHGDVHAAVHAALAELPVRHAALPEHLRTPLLRTATHQALTQQDRCAGRLPRGSMRRGEGVVRPGKA